MVQVSLPSFHLHSVHWPVTWSDYRIHLQWTGCGSEDVPTMDQTDLVWSRSEISTADRWVLQDMKNLSQASIVVGVPGLGEWRLVQIVAYYPFKVKPCFCKTSSILTAPLYGKDLNMQQRIANIQTSPIGTVGPAVCEIKTSQSYWKFECLISKRSPDVYCSAWLD